MITIPVIQECPHTVTAGGVIHINHDVLGTLAGAVYDKIEWIALLLGTRSDDGLTVHVTGFRIPLQERNSGSCELVREEPVDNGVIGVVHSHHSMGAFFSSIDDSTLNPRFPLSLVVAQHQGTDETEALLGFSYQAEGRVPLPCGSIGIIPYGIMPFPPVPEWPEQVEAGFMDPDATSPLCQCPHVTQTLEGFMATNTAQCGVVRQGKAVAIFGRNGQQFIKDVEQQTRTTRFKEIAQNWNPAKNWGIVDNRRLTPHETEQPSKWSMGFRDPDQLTHWNEARY